MQLFDKVAVPNCIVFCKNCDFYDKMWSKSTNRAQGHFKTSFLAVALRVGGTLILFNDDKLE